MAERIHRTAEEADAFMAAGLCLGSRYYPRAWALDRGEGLCASCGTYQRLDAERALVGDHRPSGRLDEEPPTGPPRLPKESER